MTSGPRMRTGLFMPPKFRSVLHILPPLRQSISHPRSGRYRCLDIQWNVMLPLRRDAAQPRHVCRQRRWPDDLEQWLKGSECVSNSPVWQFRPAVWRASSHPHEHRCPWMGGSRLCGAHSRRRNQVRAVGSLDLRTHVCLTVYLSSPLIQATLDDTSPAFVYGAGWEGNTGAQSYSNSTMQYGCLLFLSRLILTKV
jgi:hypothetical protein